MNDNFYIGYVDRAPAGLKRFVRPVIVGVFCLVVIIAVVLVTGQSPFPASFFEFGVARSFAGVIQEHPYPMLLVKRPGQTDSTASVSRYPLVAFGKFGAHDLVKGMDGQRVRLSGSLMYRDQEVMIEVADGSVVASGVDTTDMGAGKSLGFYTLVGEIVDSKCFLGVMNPGNLKPHKACAIRCISGGVPPVLVVRNPIGQVSYYLLVSEDGQTVNHQVLDKVAEPVRISGEVIVQGDLKILKADPKTYMRL